MSLAFEAMNKTKDDYELRIAQPVKWLANGLMLL